MKEYAQYVAQVRTYAEELPLSEAVEKAVDDCIKNNILAEFLAKNRAEAIAVSIFEYDEEKHMKSERKEWLTKGLEKGSDTLAQVLQSLMDAGKSKEVNRVLNDSDYRKKMLEEYFSKESGIV